MTSLCQACSQPISRLRIPWTAEQDAKLTRLWMVERKTGSQAAEYFPGKTRSAIIARVHRLGLYRELGPADVKARLPKPKVERRAPPPRIRFGHVSITKSIAPVPLPKPRAPEPITADPVTLADRRGDQCGWPVNDGAPYLFCGAIRGGHGRYCDRHAQAGVGRGRAVA